MGWGWGCLLEGGAYLIFLAFGGGGRGYSKRGDLLKLGVNSSIYGTAGVGDVQIYR